MKDNKKSEGDKKRQDALMRIVESARRLGVEIDEEEARQWLSAVSQTEKGEAIVYDAESGVFSHAVTMLDFSDEELARFRELGRLVEFVEEPGIVETALALSGSAAQSKIQTYPGDADFFERVNIKAETREEACAILARLIRDKALSTLAGSTYRLMEVRFGSYPQPVMRRGRRREAGSSISWSADEVQAGQIEVERPDGTPLTLTWEEAAADPGWCKLDWVVADSIRGELANASNMLDVTWEAPDGAITPLDGYLDPYFQEVYLEAESIPLFSKLAEHVSADALSQYVEALEEQVAHYALHDPRNYGKAAKRMYNIFRLTGRYPEAAYVRELFDEPTSLLYQVGALIRTMDEAGRPGSSIPPEAIMAQADNLIVEVVDVLEGEEESEIVRLLLRLRDGLSRQEKTEGWSAQVEAARAEVINLVNNFFHDKLTAVESIREYLDSLAAEPEAA
ncbi:MAG: hypothetical protein R3272_12120 [Candidatus Promineifilaceae bacterium]|nr:hypothetical protein [Candidatus Promineifilaceae bacterium]